MSAPERVTPALLAAWAPPPVPDDSDKEVRGRVLVLAGGAQVAGATLLTATAALRAGAGKLQIGAPAGLARSLALAMPEARVIAAPETADGELAPEAAETLGDCVARCDAAVIGPGMIEDAPAGELALRLVEAGGPPMVVDAAALSGLMADPDRAAARHGELVLTPHAGEMASLIGLPKDDILADPLGCARRAATACRAVVVLKGAATLIVSPDGTAWVHEGGLAGLATSGSGDVLAGVIAGLIARGCAPVQAAVWGVAAHARAGARLGERIAPLGFLARELLDELAPAIAELGGA
ncbi:NAD(P)H-hydrate dehydratase [Phenylobacterium sp. J367]|uniref:NAD(P)H-hydrate dehydratase n=1 Tax=Phenylobacterium sp. J367 TaxID=2898435 RepID=UPI00215180D2|nr:NAD(P)H-hydrate dehydratase [Phenylobacterium sp. J367]MCR5880855.1 NAD(P)H-hydrate dehydratase [Phenylobacterium sp. J367]